MKFVYITQHANLHFAICLNPHFIPTTAQELWFQPHNFAMLFFASLHWNCGFGKQ